jgi:hypothetical protein
LPEIGDVVGDRFEILAVLGDGGMGTVYRARDRQRGGEVALKLLIPRYLGRPEREARLLREAELLERAGRHPNLVELLEAGRLGPLGWPYLVMRVVEGESLWAHVAFRGGLTPNAAVRIARQLADAVAALHRVGVVHRDVTPANVLIEGNFAVLIDLSHAGDVGRTARLTGPHDVPGTHPYMSREQAWAEPAHPAMDVYAFGVTLAQMLLGVMTEGLSREAFIELARQGMVESPTIDPRVYPSCPSALSELISACTQADLAKRPSMNEVVARLDALLLELQPVRRAARKVYPVGGVEAEVEASVESPVEGDARRESAPVIVDDEGEEPRASSRRWIAVVVGVVLVAIVGVAWLLLGPREPVEERGAELEVKAAEREVLAADGGVRAPQQPAPVEPSGVAQGATDDGVDPSRPEAHEPAPAAAKPEPSPPKPAGKAAAPCVDPEPAAARAVVAKSWNEVLALTAKPRCWSSADLRWSYRAMALYGLGRHEQCLSAASKSSSRNAQRAAAMCREALKAKGVNP